MPLTRISMRRGKSPAYRKAIREGVYRALRETFDVPEDDRFMTVTEHDADDFDFCPQYLGIQHSGDLVIIELNVSNTRTVEQKKSLYKRIVEHLEKDPGIRPADVFINLVEVKPENWSFGNGLAQYV